MIKRPKKEHLLELREVRDLDKQRAKLIVYNVNFEAMEEKYLEILRHYVNPNDCKTVIQMLLNLHSVSNCECKNLPEGEIAISSKALTDPNWKG